MSPGKTNGAASELAASAGGVRAAAFNTARRVSEFFNMGELPKIEAIAGLCPAGAKRRGDAQGVAWARQNASRIARQPYRFGL